MPSQDVLKALYFVTLSIILGMYKLCNLSFQVCTNPAIAKFWSAQSMQSLKKSMHELCNHSHYRDITKTSGSA